MYVIKSYILSVKDCLNTSILEAFIIYYNVFIPRSNYYFKFHLEKTGKKDCNDQLSVKRQLLNTSRNKNGPRYKYNTHSPALFVCFMERMEL